MQLGNWMLIFQFSSFLIFNPKKKKKISDKILEKM